MSGVSLESSGAAYWTYMAAAMRTALGEVISTGRIRPGQVRPGVFQDALRFFKLIQESSKHKGWAAGSAVNAYELAVGACESSAPESGIANVDEYLDSLSSFIRSLDVPHELKGDENVVAQEARQFFEQLLIEGEAEKRMASHGRVLELEF